mmetsp:Transcript_33847/g.82044  ORF Transcript_33847/g.82044 Transcript_33847/m.82044 type:complete len:139 (-) Transcript_33847:201-617(-)
MVVGTLAVLLICRQRIQSGRRRRRRGQSYEAYLHHGRVDKNPAVFGIRVKLVSFDFYSIPLSKKLRDCGVFGATSDENLNYTESNRALWVQGGEAIVQEILAKYQPKTSLAHDNDTEDDDAVVFKPGDESTASLEGSN